MTSEYPFLDSRPIDKWRVTELKEELKRRQLATRGLKDELVRRLDEALRAEIEDTGEEMDNSVNDPEVVDEVAKTDEAVVVNDPESEVVDEVAKTDEAVVGKLEMDIPVNAEESVGELKIGIPINVEEMVVGESNVGIPVNAEETVVGQLDLGIPVNAEEFVVGVGESNVGIPVNAEETVVGQSDLGIPVNAEEFVVGDLEIGIPINAEETVVGESDAGIPINKEETAVGDNSINSELEIASVPVDVEDRAEQPHREEVSEPKETELVNDQHTGMEMSSATVPSAAMGAQVPENLSLETTMGVQKLQDDKPERDNEEIASVQVDVEDRAEQPHREEVSEPKETELVNDQHTGMEMSSATVPSAAIGAQVPENLSLETTMGVRKLQDDKPERDNEESRAQQDSNYTSPTHEDVKLDFADSNNQVSEVSSNLGFPLKSNSNSTNSISICEKKELEDNVIADDVKLETDVKPEMVQPSSNNLVPVGGESHPKGVEEPLENEISVEGRENNVPNADISQKNLSASLGSSEKLNLDRSSGDDSMEEDALESKQIDSNYNIGEVGVMAEKSEVTPLKEETPFTAMDTDFHVEERYPSEDKHVLAASADKRKLPDQESGLNIEPSKRQRRWKSEGSNIREQSQISNITLPVTAKDVPKSAAQIRNVSRSGSDRAMDSPKEREVPTSTKAATNSIRIDNFLRPFTLKAVQDLLGKTGTVASFWMDHIKTHCYVTYSTVEEAVSTRNAVYNLQWPPNGGRYLVAEFVDPKEVKLRVDPTIVPTRAAATTAPELPPPPKKQQLSPRQQDLRQQLISKQTTLPLPPPPPLSNSLPARERVHPIPPMEEKEEAPILTLDDLFRKTKTTPRIYYLPLSEEQVSSTLEARQKNSGQPPIA